jgi:hypothetical protein
MSVAMTSSDETVVPLSKTKLVLLIIGSIGFVALGFWIFQTDSAWIEAQRRFNNPMLVHGIGIVAMVFFGLGVVVGIRKLFDPKPGLVLSSAGMLITSGSTGLIPWDDVEGFTTHEIHRQKMLVVKLVDPEKYVRAGGALRQALRRTNMNMMGSPIALSSNTLEISYDELVALCGRYLEKYEKRSVRAQGPR